MREIAHLGHNCCPRLLDVLGNAAWATVTAVDFFLNFLLSLLIFSLPRSWDQHILRAMGHVGLALLFATVGHAVAGHLDLPNPAIIAAGCALGVYPVSALVWRRWRPRRPAEPSDATADDDRPARPLLRPGNILFAIACAIVLFYAALDVKLRFGLFFAVFVVLVALALLRALNSIRPQ